MLARAAGSAAVVAVFREAVSPGLLCSSRQRLRVRSLMPSCFAVRVRLPLLVSRAARAAARSCSLYATVVSSLGCWFPPLPFGRAPVGWGGVREMRRTGRLGAGAGFEPAGWRYERQ